MAAITDALRSFSESPIFRVIFPLPAAVAARAADMLDPKETGQGNSAVQVIGELALVGPIGSHVIRAARRGMSPKDKNRNPSPRNKPNDSETRYFETARQRGENEESAKRIGRKNSVNVQEILSPFLERRIDVKKIDEMIKKFKAAEASYHTKHAALLKAKGGYEIARDERFIEIERNVRKLADPVMESNGKEMVESIRRSFESLEKDPRYKHVVTTKEWREFKQATLAFAQISYDTVFLRMIRSAIEANLDKKVQNNPTLKHNLE